LPDEVTPADRRDDGMEAFRGRLTSKLVFSNHIWMMRSKAIPSTSDVGDAAHTTAGTAETATASTEAIEGFMAADSVFSRQWPGPPECLDSIARAESHDRVVSLFVHGPHLRLATPGAGSVIVTRCPACLLGWEGRCSTEVADDSGRGCLVVMS